MENQRKDRAKAHSSYIINRVYQFLKENPELICFRKYRGCIEGMYEPDTSMICIDPRKDIVPTLIHELLHHWHPEWCESKVVKEEQKVMKYLSLEQIKHVIKRLGYII